jgi:hypothetical protein
MWSHENLLLLVIWGLGAAQALGLSDIVSTPKRIGAMVCNTVALGAFIVLTWS